LLIRLDFLYLIAIGFVLLPLILIKERQPKRLPSKN